MFLYDNDILKLCSSVIPTENDAIMPLHIRYGIHDVDALEFFCVCKSHA